MKYLFLAAVSVVLFGCGSIYKPANTQGTVSGYEEAKVSDGLYRLSFVGGSSSVENYKYFLKRAGELSLKDGYAYFEVENGSNADLVRGMQNIGAGEIKIPKYEGTVRMLKNKTSKSLEAKEVAK